MHRIVTRNSKNIFSEVWIVKTTVEHNNKSASKDGNNSRKNGD